ncbi:ABC transporter ATP-binding protein [soil metagenome]
MSHTDAAQRTRSRTATRLLVRTGRHAGPWVAVLSVNALVLSAADLALPAVLGQTLDAVLGGGATAGWLGAFGVLVLILVLGDVLEEWGVGAATARSTAWLRHSGLRHLLSVRPRGAQHLEPGELSARLVGNTAEAGTVAPDAVRAATVIIPAVGGTVALFLIDPWLGLTFVVGAPVFIVLLAAFAREAADLSTRYLAAQGQIAGRLVQALSGARTIAAAGTRDRETARVLAPLADLHRHGMGMWRAQTRITAQDVLVLSFVEIAVLAVGGLQLSKGQITPGDLLAATQYVALAATFGSVVPSITRLLQARAGADRVGDVLGIPPVVYGLARLPAAGGPGGPASGGMGRVEFQGVTVRQQGRLVLDRLRLVVPAGSMVALVGAAGSGKSLLAALAGRLLDPDEGQVCLDDVPLPDLDRDELRRAVGYGFERPALIGATLHEVIGFGADPASEHQVHAAARAARADEFIRRMPLGYQTPLGQAPMSGGEMQRMGLARTFAHAGRVVILDDVAASLDTVTEHEISRALTGEMSDRTRILVAHRASTAARAETVVWLEHGRVRRMAPHRELWTEPAYRALFDAGVVAQPVRTPAAVGRRS